jgi:ribosomal protein L30E
MNVKVELCNLLGYYAALSGSSVPTFRDNLSDLSSMVKKSEKKVPMLMSVLICFYESESIIVICKT